MARTPRHSPYDPEFADKPDHVSDNTIDFVGNIIAFENGELDEEETIAFFQHLVNTGLAWTLQGTYGRTAMALIEAGLVTR
jgi:hypothetical protein